ncbi:metal-dependent hydrolase [Mycobacterium intracellulare]|uniref:metal-dependent hydrolase n=1 Tax=Mycobacterium intracellulare TaxID=1767 RepID=UPI001E45A873|nr:metal-dependent hydrolase [Mycobacterium intracellulare]
MGEGSKYFFDDDITFSQLWANLSRSFPPGEELFIRSVHRFADEITDPGSKKRMAGFTQSAIGAWPAASGAQRQVR